MINLQPGKEKGISVTSILRRREKVKMRAFKNFY
jgi:hypothetical protein